ncbi:MAG: anaerobic ribonucleoside-triphosphate reductase activating protein [Candidatus Thiodiazotropha sp.]
MSETQLKVGGLQPLTTLDYPDHLAAVVFCQGCPMRCRYCHNPELLPRSGVSRIPWDEVLAFLGSRRGLLDGVVFSGGEPTQQRVLEDAIREVRAMGFEIGLHTSGVYPRRLQRLLPLLDWVGLDLKALPEHYPALTGMPGSGALAWRSARLLEAYGRPYQLRTTYHPSLMSAAQRRMLKRLLVDFPLAEHVWQTCRTEHSLDVRLLAYPVTNSVPFSASERDRREDVFRRQW